jgi:hypothetical protein
MLKNEKAFGITKDFYELRAQKQNCFIASVAD